jgi:plastocyanin
MRARKLAAVAALSVALMVPSLVAAVPAEAQLADGCAPTELSADGSRERPAMCRQFSLFGLRFSPKVMRIKVNAPKGTPPNQFPAGTSIKLMWRNGDRYDHQLQSILARDTEGNLMGVRNAETGETDCTGATTCFDYNAPLQPARPPPVPGQKRDAGTNSQEALLPRPGTYTFQCLIHTSMTQTIVVTNQPKFR